MTNPKLICFLLAAATASLYFAYYLYANRHRIHERLEGWLCYELCKDLADRGIPIEPATHWVHRKAFEYALKHGKDAVFMTMEI